MPLPKSRRLSPSIILVNSKLRVGIAIPSCSHTLEQSLRHSCCRRSAVIVFAAAIRATTPTSIQAAVSASPPLRKNLLKLGFRLASRALENGFVGPRFDPTSRATPASRYAVKGTARLTGGLPGESLRQPRPPNRAGSTRLPLPRDPRAAQADQPERANYVKCS